MPISPILPKIQGKRRMKSYPRQGTHCGQPAQQRRFQGLQLEPQWRAVAQIS
jgi:hypothetical protein